MIVVKGILMRALLMIPTYNEHENLENLVDEVVLEAPDIDILVIDDSSPDGTGAIADRLVQKYRQFGVMHRPPKSGRGSASVAGYRYAIEKGYDRYLEIDCDHSHSPKELPRVLSAAKNADLVIGSRFLDKSSAVNGWSLYRKALHYLADHSIRFILGLHITDPTNGYHCYSVEMLKHVNFDRLRSDGYVAHTILKALLNKAGFKIVEVPSVFLNRTKGRSKMSSKEARQGIKDMLVFRWLSLTRGYRYFIL